MFFRLAGRGRIAVVLEAGSGGDHRSWSRLEPLLSGRAQVVSYDRLGFGLSGRSKRPRTAAIAAEQLRDGLRKARIRPPYLLVGHSYGGAIVRLFASQYPTEVFGLVLVDPAMERFYPRAAIEEPEAYLQQVDADLTNDDARASEALKREYLGYEASMLQARLAKPIPGERIILLSAAKMEIPPALRRLWLDEQEEWARSTGARRILVDSGHAIQRQQPEAVANAVLTILALPAPHGD